MRGLVLMLLAAVVAAAAAEASPATPPGADGSVLFSQPRCPGWAGRRCSFADQPCAVDPATGRTFVPALPAANAVLSPDGRSVAWTAYTSLLVAAADGRGAHSIAQVEPADAWPAWSPDGTQIVLNGFTLANPAPLIAVDVATAAARTLTSGVFEPSWSPDGTEIAAAFAYGIKVVPADGGPVRTIVSEPDTSSNQGDSEPDWSPDSSTLVFTHIGNGNPSRLQLVHRDGSGRIDLTQGSFASWSPGGGEIAFVRDAAPGERQIWAVRPDGSGERPLSATPLVRDARPRWLNAQQTAALRPAGNCDLSASENDERVEGGEGVDTIFVTGVRNEVAGNGGNDLVWVSDPGVFGGGGGPERIDGGAGNDDFELYGGQNTALGGPGDDRMDALFTNLPQRLLGGPGRDWIRGGGADDVIDGGAGPDALYGYFGANTIHGGAGNDVVSAYSGSRPQRLFGDAGNDRLVGGRGPDRLDGGAGADTILARDGTRDTVRCGAGRDTALVDRRDVVARDCERVLRAR